MMGKTYPLPARCPICSAQLQVTKLSCNECGTSIEGHFQNCRFCQLDAEQLQFLEVFLRCRGMLSGVEKELQISYPTARNKLDALLLALGMTPVPTLSDGQVAKAQQEVLDQLERGEITAEEAARKLRAIK
ncbi:MAG: DUF2089 domain-containing protein [Fimbriimonadales bacterium]